MKKALVGGAVFFRSNTFISNLIRFSGFFQNGFKKSDWSHVGSVFWHNEQLYLIEAMPEGVIARPLFDALESHLKKGDFFEIKKLKPYMRERFQEDVYNHTCESYVGKDYNFIGAIASGLDWPINIQTKTALHCSFLDCYLKQIGKVASPYFNPNEFTPQDCYNLEAYE